MCIRDRFYGKVDAYLTGDTKYRHAKNAIDYHLLLVDIPVSYTHLDVYKRQHS